MAKEKTEQQSLFADVARVFAKALEREARDAKKNQ